MIQHSEQDRILLRKMGMSERSELTPEERSRMKLVRAAYQKNPNITSHRLYRTLRPLAGEEASCGQQD